MGIMTARGKTVLVAGCLLGWISATGAWAADDNVVKMLSFRPKRQDVIYSRPAANEQDQCKVDVLRDKGTFSYLLRDPKGLPLVKLTASNGKKLDITSFYLDGVEVYRESDTDRNGNVDQYRWLNAGGMKWGLSSKEDGTIDSWRTISPEEVSQEALQAVLTKDFARLNALWLTDAELRTLDLPAKETTRLRDLRAQAAAKFQTVAAKLAGLEGQTRWVRLETAPPQCLAREQTGLQRDLIKYPRGTILYENNGKHDWLQLGEMIQIGPAWRIVDAPSTGDAAGDASTVAADKEIQPLLDELRLLDAKQQPKSQDTPGPNPALVTYNLDRANVLQKIVAKVKADDREQWTRQVADCLSAAAQASADNDRTAYDRLVQLEQQVAAEKTGSALAAYVTFREMSADYAGKLAKASGADFAKVQGQWLERLAKYVDAFPKTEDTPDALLQLGMVSEFLGKEIEARKWYQRLATDFADKKPLADKAAGALRRIDLEGKPLELVGTTAAGVSFNINQLHDKLVVVYYWASWNQQSVGDFARLKLLLNTYGKQGLELVCVNLDNSPPEANGALDRNSLPGVQLCAPGGLDSPLATQYGIMVLPNLFLVGKDGKVLSRSVQLATLEDEIKKGLK
jgi:hypothetical protein